MHLLYLYWIFLWNALNFTTKSFKFNVYWSINLIMQMNNLHVNLIHLLLIADLNLFLFFSYLNKLKYLIFAVFYDYVSYLFKNIYF